MLDGVNVRHHFLVPELVGGAGDGAVLVGEILGSEDLIGCRAFEQKGPAQVFRRGNGGSCHDYPLQLFKFSKIPAAPWPPPTHIVTIPYLWLRRAISRRMVAVSFDPVQPSG